MPEVCEPGVTLSKNLFKISPTFLSSDILTPLQLPPRSTVPKSNTIAEDSCRLPYMKWKTNCCELSDVHASPILQKLKIVSKRFPAECHRSISSSYGTAVHPSIQSCRECLAHLSKLRVNDEFIVAPSRCRHTKIMQEENHLRQEPCYSSHISKNVMFPQARAERTRPPLSGEQLQRAPLSEITSQALDGVVHRRYRISTSASQFANPCSDKQDVKRKDNKAKSLDEEFEITDEIPEDNAMAHYQIKGLWPCWPAGTNTITNSITGLCVEKNDIATKDDEKDYRKYKFLSQRGRSTYDDAVTKSDVTSFAGSELVPLKNLDVCGCGPGRIGHGNTDTEVPFGVHNQQKYSVDQIRRALSGKTDWGRHQFCDGDFHAAQYEPHPPSYRPEPNYEASSYNHQKRFDQLKRYRCQPYISDEMRERWLPENKIERLQEHTSLPQNNSDDSPPEEGLPFCYSRECADLEVQDVDEKEDEEKEEKNKEDNEANIYFVEKTEKQSDINSNNSSKKLSSDIVQPPYAVIKSIVSTADTRKAFLKSDPFMLSLELDRNNDRVSGLLKSADSPHEERRIALETLKSQRIQRSERIAQLNKKRKDWNAHCDKDSPFYRPPIKLPPHELWTTLEYNGDRVSHRLGAPFKSVAFKRYHAVHQEPVPDLRDNVTAYRRDRMFGFHTSVFR